MGRDAGTLVEDVRFDVPLYTIAQASSYVRVPPTTFRSWAKGYEVNAEPGRRVTGKPVITALTTQPGKPTIPFIALAEGMVLAAFRAAGVSLQHIRQVHPRLGGPCRTGPCPGV